MTGSLRAPEERLDGQVAIGWWDAIRQSLTTEKKVAAGFAAAFIAVLALAATGYYATQGFRRDSQWVAHTLSVLQNIESIRASLNQAVSAHRGQMLIGDPVFIEDERSSLARMDDSVAALARLVADNPSQRDQLPLLKQQMEAFHVLLAADRQPGLDSTGEALRAQTLQVRQAAAAARDLLTRMHDAEEELLITRTAAVDSKAGDLFLIFGGILAAVTLFLLALYPRISREIAQRWRAQQRSEQLLNEIAGQTAQLTATNRELEAFSYSVSHDLRAPVRAIDGFARMLETEHAAALDEEGRRLLSVVRASSRRMGQLIDDLLSFSRLGRQAIKPMPFDSKTMVQAVVQEAMAQDPVPRPTIHVGTLPAASGDPVMITQVWANLIGNAIKYSSRKPQPEIRIDGREAGAEVIFRIRDNGTGFDMRYYDKLFGVFQRLHNPNDFPGTGVGLAIVDRIVSRHGGRVWAEAVLEQGATFLFSLPRSSV